jgi:tricorn protease
MFITGTAPGAALDKPVNMSGLTTSIDPREEWKQVITDTWRIYRDFFYDPNMHGVDWPRVRDRALYLVQYAANREDVEYIIEWMASELNTSHTYVWAPSTEQQRWTSCGMLGCDFELATDVEGREGYRISRIYHGADWEIDARGPLMQPGVEVHEGDFLLAVNGKPVSMAVSPYASLQGLAGQPTSITVSEKAVIDDSARKALVQPQGDEYELRLRDWIEKNRQYVSDQTGGKVGYIYIRNTSWEGLIDLQRQFLGQHNKEGVVIDERWNGGGFIPHRFIEMLNRPVRSYWARRDGLSWRTPYRTIPGPKVMLVNYAAGSGGDAFPYYFRQAGLGKLVGTRTWGGLVGISGNPQLIDGSGLTVPTFGIYELDGTWGIEGHGVDPDIEVINDPTSLALGKDLQLDKAIEVVVGEIEQHPYVDVPKPPYPDRSRSGVLEDEK